MISIFKRLSTNAEDVKLLRWHAEDQKKMDNYGPVNETLQLVTICSFFICAQFLESQFVNYNVSMNQCH